MGHHCCVPHCGSTSRLSGNGGLTFHSFPVDQKERKLWIVSIRKFDYKKLTINKHTKVCSKHFRNEDFIQPLGSKRRMLKKGVVPSIFTWNDNHESNRKVEPSSNESDEPPVKEETKTQKRSDAKANFVETDKQLFVRLKSEPPEMKSSLDNRMKDRTSKKENENNCEELSSSNPSCSSPSKSDDSEHGSISDLTVTNGSSPVSSTNGTPNKKQALSINFQIGIRLEAKDLGNEMWYPVKVVEVDWDEEEVLIHFEKWSQRYDEWIPMDSSRLRATQNPTPQSDGKIPSKVFNVGDRVMAKWTDCRRYPARVKTVLGNDRYEVLFLDGFTKVIKGIRMTKLEGEAENTVEAKPSVSEKPPPPRPVKPVVRNAVTEEAIGTKEERRERKRKINVAELFHPKKRAKLEPGSTPPRLSSDTEKGRKVEKGKRRKENNSSTDNEGQTEDVETPKGRKKELVEDSSKSSYKASPKDNVKEEDSKWVSDGQDGYIVDSIDGPRKTTVIPDKNLPSGWSKHSIQRKHGNSAGKWDVFLVSPQGRRFRSRGELRQYFEESGEPFKADLFDFSASGRRRSRNLIGTPTAGRRGGSRGGIRVRSKLPPIGPGGDAIEQPQSQGQPPTPLQIVQPQRRVKTLLPKIRRTSTSQSEDDNGEKSIDPPSPPPPYTTTVASVPAIKIETEMLEGEVLVGGLKIQMDGNSYKCPKDGCGKNFRKENLLQMHIKHYHPEYNKFMGSTPNVADLAYARTIGESIDDLMPKSRYNSGGSGGVAYAEKMSRFDNVRKSKGGVPTSMGSGKGGVVGGGGDGSPVPEKKKMAAKEKLQNALAAKKAGKGVPADGEGRAQTEDHTIGEKESMEEKTTVADNREVMSTPVMDVVTAMPYREEKKEQQTTIKTLLPVIRSPSHVQETSAAERVKSKFPPVEEGEEYIEVIDVGPRQMQPVHGASLTPTPQSSGASLQGATSFTKSLRTIRRRRLSDFHFEPLHKRRKIASKLEVSEDVDVVDDSGSPVDIVSTPTGAASTGGTPGSTKSTPTTYRYSRKKTPVVHLEKLNVTTDSNGRVILSSSMKEKAEIKSLETQAETPVVEQLRKEELINCTCGFMEEDGLMIQCDLCLCWQHGICNNIEKETEVPEKYVCPICLNPYRQRKSKKYMHDQDWLKEGKLPSLSFRSKNEANIVDREAILKRSHDLTGSLLQIQQVLHSLRVKVNIAGKPDHPKMYLWAKSWEKDGESSSQIPGTQTEIEFKPQLEDITEIKAEMSTDIVTETNALVDKNIVSDAEKGLQENVASVKKESIESPIKQSEIETERMEIDVKETVSEVATEQTLLDEEATQSEEVAQMVSVESTINKIESEMKVDSSENVGNEVECSSDVNPLENKETGSDDKDAETAKDIETVSKNEETEGVTQETTKDPNVDESSNKIEAMKEETLIEDDVQSTIEVTDSNIASAPEVTIKESESNPVEEKTDEASSLLDNHGLLHQALTNGSHVNNPLNGGLGSQIDASNHPMLQLPICQSELMRFASTMADNLRVTESSRPVPVPEPPRAPQPEAPIDPVECRLLLLDHIDHFQQQIDTRLTMLEEQVAALESQDPDAAKDEGADHYPQTKQTIQMLLRDLLTMRKISGLN